MGGMDAMLEQLSQWMETDEDEHLEFKEAKVRYDFEKLVKYCAALANGWKGIKFQPMPWLLKKLEQTKKVNQ